MKLVVRPQRGGLAPWQIKRAEEKLVANLEGNVSVAGLAADCGVSVSHFARGFRQLMGLSPHQWLLRRRVDEAKRLMRNRTLPLAEVALTCGFVDQSHFTRVFTRRIGISPSTWRRNLA
jgi:AraC family transcriptional regulator